MSIRTTARRDRIRGALAAGFGGGLPGRLPG